mgnify:CR=1 FL=1
MKRSPNGAAVPRYLVFVLGDGTFVVQWTETHVQELLSGHVRPYRNSDFAHPIHDDELDRLKAAGSVEYYNRGFVWLYALPERRRFVPEPRIQERTSDRIRGYYLNTTLPETELDYARHLLNATGLATSYEAKITSSLVAIFSRNGMPFRNLRDTEQALSHLQTAIPGEFDATVIAFLDLPADSGVVKTAQTADLLDLGSIIAAQTDTSLTEGKRVVVACRTEDHALPVIKLLAEMKMDVHGTTSGRDALELLEDLQPDLLVMDLQLADMHGWQILASLREIDSLQSPLTIVLGDDDTSLDEQSLGLSVARVDAYLARPLSLSRLRHYVWYAFQQQAAREAAS